MLDYLKQLILALFPCCNRALAYLLPLCNQVSIGISLLQKVLVQLLGDRLALIKELIDITRPLVVQSENGPQCLDLSLSLMRIVFS